MAGLICSPDAAGPPSRHRCALPVILRGLCWSGVQLVASRCRRNASSSHACSSPLIARQRNTAARPPFSYPCRTRCLRITTPANRLTQEPAREVSPEPTPARASFDSPAIRGSLDALHRLRNQQLQPVSPRSLALLPWNPCRPTATGLHSILYPSAAPRIFSPVPASPRRRSLLDVSARQWQWQYGNMTPPRPTANTNDRPTWSQQHASALSPSDWQKSDYRSLSCPSRTSSVQLRTLVSSDSRAACASLCSQAPHRQDNTGTGIPNLHSRSRVQLYPA